MNELWKEQPLLPGEAERYVLVRNGGIGRPIARCVVYRLRNQNAWKAVISVVTTTAWKSRLVVDELPSRDAATALCELRVGDFL